jgi:hypothetical protein
MISADNTRIIVTLKHTVQTCLLGCLESLCDRKAVTSIFILLTCIVLRAHLEYLGVDGWIILKWIFKLWVGGLDWIDVNHGDKWSDRVRTVMNFLEPWIAVNFSTNSWATGFCRRTVLRGVNPLTLFSASSLQSSTICLLQYYMTPKLEYDILLWGKECDYTGWSKSLCAPDDCSTKERKNILNSFKHLLW